VYWIQMISGRRYADRCRWVVDVRYPEKTQFSYSKSQDGDWVFINGDYIDSFFQHLPLLASKRYYVIIHNSDRTFTETLMEKLRKYVYHVYAINTNFEHPRLTTIPIGFADNQLEFLSTFTPAVQDRDIEIYINFKLQHNAEKRNECYQTFKNNPTAVYRERVDVPEYYNDLCRSKFVLCPEGTGIDTHRVYEAILCGATPVVLRNSLSHLYEKLPVCIVDKWTDKFYIPDPRQFSTDVMTYLKSET
jgi:hypothetical protein